MRRESAISALVNAQHGVASRAQLLELGFSNGDVDRRVRSGRLHRVHHGVYAFGHRVLTVQGRWLAAVLAAGNGAVLSHASAAAACDLRPPLEQLSDRADQRGLVNFDVLRTATPASLQAVLDSYAPAPTRSELEERFLPGLRRSRHPAARHERPHRRIRGRLRLARPTRLMMRFTWRHVTERAAWVAAAIG